MLSGNKTSDREQRDGEQGYILLAALVAIALVLIALSVAATKVAFSLKREREEESVRRANQYVRAIREYYLKFHNYPGSIEQLEKSNNIRFLRQQYVDPLTGKPDWRLIHVGQNKTQVTGFFGEPLTGLPTSGLGAAAGMQSPGMGGGGDSGCGNRRLWRYWRIGCEPNDGSGGNGGLGRSSRDHGCRGNDRDLRSGRHRYWVHSGERRHWQSVRYELHRIRRRPDHGSRQQRHRTFNH